MSVLSDVISRGRPGEGLSLDKEMKSTRIRIEKLRDHVLSLMNEKYVSFALADTAPALAPELEELTVKVTRLKHKVNQQTEGVSKLSDELKHVREFLEDSQITCSLLKKLLDFDEQLTLFNSSLSSHNYHSCATHAIRLRSLLDESAAELEELELFDCLLTEVSTGSSMVTSTALDSWNKSVAWSVSSEDSLRLVSLRVSATKTILGDIFCCLDLFGFSVEILSKFSHVLLEELINSCLVHKSKIELSLKDDCVLTLYSNPEEQPTPSEVISNLKTIFTFLDDALQQVTIDQRTFLGDLSAESMNVFFDKLEQLCLSKAIPTDREKLPAYQSFVNELSSFEALLTKIGYLTEKHKVFEDYCSNIEKQFMNRMIEKYLTEARDILKQNLHETVLTASSDSPRSGSPVTVKKEEPEASIAPCNESKDEPLFPKCQISKNAVEIISLVKQILESFLKEKDNENRIKLFSTAKDVITLYAKITPVYHARVLSSLPNQAALFHNSCLYIGHELVQLCNSLRSRATQPPFKGAEILLDDFTLLRVEAVKVLDVQVVKQEKLLIETVEQSGLKTLSEYDELPPVTTNSLKQCSHHLNYLQSLWMSVLPSNVYCRIMGQLSNSLVSEIISTVLSIKDIRADTATRLVEAFSEIQKSIPPLFEEPNEIHRHVKSWSKFNELIVVLGASLVQIDNRWADGKGPLAAEFTPAQIRGLVQALFQVSQRRSAVLAKMM